MTGVEPTLVALARGARAGGVRDRVRGRAAAAAHVGAVARVRTSTQLAARSTRRRRAARVSSTSSIPCIAARSTLEVKTRRLLVAHGFTDFVREFPLAWSGRTLPLRLRVRTAAARSSRPTAAAGTTTPRDYEHDNEKWSVPGRHGYRIVFATWDKVTRDPEPTPRRSWRRRSRRRRRLRRGCRRSGRARASRRR